MNYVDTSGEGHELPKYTRALAKRVEQAQGETEREKRWKLELAVVQECLGDSAEAVLDGRTLDEVDISVLDAEFEGIAAAYEAPRREAQAERIDATLSAVDLERLEALATAMDSLSQRQGFKNVK